MFDQAVRGVIYINVGRVVDVLDDHVALVAVENALAVGPRVNAVREHRHAAVAVEDRDRFVAVHTCVCEAYRRLYALDVLTEVHQHEIDAIYADVEQRAAGQFGPDDALDMRDRIGQVCGQCIDLSDDAARERVVDQSARRHVAGPDGFRNIDLILTREAHDLACLLRGLAEGLLAEGRLFVLDAELHMFKMMRVRRRDIHELYLGVREHFLIAAVRALIAVICREFLCLRKIARSDRPAFYLFHLF